MRPISILLKLCVVFRTVKSLRTSSLTPSEQVISGSYSPEIEILLETDRLMAINKPAGISFHSSSSEDGILKILRSQKPDQRLYGVHRLDKVTSGILLLAKDAIMARTLTRAFREGIVMKHYTALSCSKRKKKMGWVRGGMQRSRRKSWALTTETKNYAKTRFFTAGLGHLPPTSEMEDPKTLILFRPYTGRTHQLRVAAKSVGLAIAGDPIYSSSTMSRTYLHATGLYIPDVISVWCPPPFESIWDDTTDFETVLDKLIHTHCEHPR